MSKRKSRVPWSLAAASVVAGILAGCAALPGSKLADSADGRVEISESPGAPPVVVFESGLLSHKEVWNKVFPPVSAAHAAFAYNRPGVGGSDSTARPRDGAAIVEDLRKLLSSRRLPPPYVLVGHSAGGLYMQLYARKYPGEVAGLVLVDPTHPTQFEGEGAMSKRSTLDNVAVALVLTGNMREEFDRLSETGRDVLAAPPLSGAVPTVVLVAPNTSGTAMAAFDNAKRADFAKLYPHAVVREVDGGHNVPQVQPQAVVAAVEEVIRLARQKVVAKP